MLRMGLMFLFGTFSHSIITIIAYQFYFRYSIVNGGIGGTMISNIHPFIWIIIIIELVISAGLIRLGTKEKSK